MSVPRNRSDQQARPATAGGYDMVRFVCPHNVDRVTQRSRAVTIETIREALLWCGIINMAILLYWFVVFALAHDLVYRIHSRWYSMPVERFDALHYAGMMGFKLAIFALNFVPYAALHIVA